MSLRLISAVRKSDLTAWLRPYAQAYAFYAKDDGTQVFPSVARVARDVKRSERQTQTATAELRQRGILVTVCPHGPGRPTRYWFNADALPKPGDGDQLPLWAKLGRKKRFPQAN